MAAAVRRAMETKERSEVAKARRAMGILGRFVVTAAPGPRRSGFSAIGPLDAHPKPFVGKILCLRRHFGPQTARADAAARRPPEKANPTKRFGDVFALRLHLRRGTRRHRALLAGTSARSALDPRLVSPRAGHAFHPREPRVLLRFLGFTGRQDRLDLVLRGARRFVTFEE